MNKNKIIDECRLRQKELQPERARDCMSCLYATMAAVEVLRGHGLNAVIQAGSMSWPFIDYDDGVSPTHFSYIWSPGEPGSLFSMSAGNLPELHAWVGVIDTNEIVDIQTKYIPEAAREYGFEWKAELPPDYLWADSLPDGVYYDANLEASLFAKLCIESVKRGRKIHPADLLRHVLENQKLAKA